MARRWPGLLLLREKIVAQPLPTRPQSRFAGGFATRTTLESEASCPYLPPLRDSPFAFVSGRRGAGECRRSRTRQPGWRAATGRHLPGGHDPPSGSPIASLRMPRSGEGSSDHLRRAPAVRPHPRRVAYPVVAPVLRMGIYDGRRSRISALSWAVPEAARNAAVWGRLPHVWAVAAQTSCTKWTGVLFALAGFETGALAQPPGAVG
jgi:hypothetical protein